MKQLQNFETSYPTIGDLLDMSYSHEEAANILRVCNDGLAGDPHIVWRSVRDGLPKNG